MIVGIVGLGRGYPNVYPAWAFYAMRGCVYFSLGLGFISFLAIFFPRQHRGAIASLIAAFLASIMLLGTASFLTEGDPQPIPYPTTTK
jgi:membrane-bound metal-dependent hydrolase YbcI (DUF457 family)